MKNYYKINYLKINYNWTFLLFFFIISDWYNTPNSIPNVTINKRAGGLDIINGWSQGRPGYIIRRSNDSSTKNVWLFDIASDPTELTDLSETNPGQVDYMLERLAYYYQNVMRPEGCNYPNFDLLADPCWTQGNILPWVVNNQPPPQYN